jgi:hypothetical protein
MTREELSRMQTAMQKLIKKWTLQDQLDEAKKAIPDGPFAELIKMVAHYGQIPSCKTCIHRLNEFCTRTKDEDWYEVKPTHFCAEWNPEQPGASKKCL